MFNELKNKKPTIHFILPGGGVRGAFQAGFLYTLFTKYKDFFEISRIDGTSVGSINGIAVMAGEYDILKKMWFNINCLNDLFNNWYDYNLMGRWISYYKGFFRNGLYSNNKLRRMLTNHIENSWKNIDNDFKNKYSCAVVNVNNATSEYINGENPKIFEYITASASPWIVSNPIIINNEIYTDGGLLETYPIKNIDKCNADLTIIVGYDQEHIHFKKANNSNLLEYLATLIDIARYNSDNIQKMRLLIDNDKIIKLVNPMNISFIEFNKENIQYGFIQGSEFADSFYSTYLNN